MRHRSIAMFPKRRRGASDQSFVSALWHVIASESRDHHAPPGDAPFRAAHRGGTRHRFPCGSLGGKPSAHQWRIRRRGSRSATAGRSAATTLRAIQRHLRARFRQASRLPFLAPRRSRWRRSWRRRTSPCGTSPAAGTLEKAHAVGPLERCGPGPHSSAPRWPQRDLLALRNLSCCASRL